MAWSTRVGAPMMVAAVARAFSGHFSVIWPLDDSSRRLLAAVTSLAGEVRTSQRTLPVGLLLGLAFIAAASVGTNVVYFPVLGFNGVATSDAVAAQTLGAAIGPRAAQVIAVLVMCSTLGTMAARCIGQSRYYLAPAEDGLFPRMPARIRPRTQTPGSAAAALAGMAMFLVLFGNDSASIADDPRALLVALFVPVTGTVVYAVARWRGALGKTSGTRA